jgi:hypothetical protein
MSMGGGGLHASCSQLLSSSLFIVVVFGSLEKLGSQERSMKYLNFEFLNIKIKFHCRQ